MKALYESHFIDALLRRKPESDRWLVRVRVSWQGDKREIRWGDGPSDGFETKEEAEKYGIDLGRRWIDEKRSRRDSGLFSQ